MAGVSKVPRSLVGSLVEALIEFDAKQALKYLSDRLVVKATRKTYRRDGKRIDNRDSSISISLKIGAPNYIERQFIKKCKKAGVPFPVKKIQFKFPSKKGKKKR